MSVEVAPELLESREKGLAFSDEVDHRVVLSAVGRPPDPPASIPSAPTPMSSLHSSSSLRPRTRRARAATDRASSAPSAGILRPHLRPCLCPPLCPYLFVLSSHGPAPAGPAHHPRSSHGFAADLVRPSPRRTSRPQPGLCTVRCGAARIRRRHRRPRERRPARRPQGWPWSGPRPPARSRSTRRIRRLDRRHRPPHHAGRSGAHHRCSCLHALEDLQSRLPGVEFADLEEAAHVVRRLTAATAAGRQTRSTASGSGPVRRHGARHQPVGGRTGARRCCGSWRRAWSSVPVGSGRRHSPCEARSPPFTSLIPVTRKAVSRFDHLERSPSMSLSLFRRFVIPGTWNGSGESQSESATPDRGALRVS